ncbi:hypothetical protein [Nocardiopsis kunsanensis]|uniref:hypothetical protein n=1 Tax=Nocardiopsis kunsanensis TaxID=141693 RepID=UPI00034CDC03|nr:hypothetical protein [Nocardiopsis kunsanensis]
MIRTYSADDPAADLPLTPEEQQYADAADRIREQNRRNAMEREQARGLEWQQQEQP